MEAAEDLQTQGGVVLVTPTFFATKHLIQWGAFHITISMES